MGVDIGELSVKHELELESLGGKTIAFDALNTIFQFLSSIRQQDGTPLSDSNGNVTGHLSGLFYRNAKFIELGIKPVFVFDGKPPSFKKKTIEERQERRDAATVAWKAALEKGDEEQARKYAQASSHLTKEMIAECKELLSAMGIQVIEAPSEGEAQASVMAAEGRVYGTCSQDYDSLLFGCPNLLRNLSVTGRRKLHGRNEWVPIKPHSILLEETLKANGLTRQQLVWIGLLIGNDYEPGVKGIGPKKALKLVKECKTLGQVERGAYDMKGYKFECDIEEIERFFLHPPVVKDIEIVHGEADLKRIGALLCDKHDFSSERVGRTVDLIVKKQTERGVQSTLGQW
jgi:flap endonuclease-1